MHSNSPATVIGWLIDAVSKNGTLLLNVSPRADGTIPMDQQETLLAIGKWLETNGEAIYDTHAWVKFEEEGSRKIHFTVKGEALYAIVEGKSAGPDVLLPSLSHGKVSSVEILGGKTALRFSQNAAGLKVSLPEVPAGEEAYTLKIRGLKMNPQTATRSGNPLPNNGVMQ